MKHINVMLMLLIIMVILLGCGQMNTDSEDKTVEPEQTAVGTTSAEKAESQSFKVIEIQNFDGERGAVFEREGVNNAKTACKIAGAILEQYQEEGLFKNYRLQLVEHDSEKGLWIVSFWADDEQSGSLSLPFEAVLERAGEADVWMLRYSSDHELTYDELLSDYHGYSQLRAFRNREVYGCNVELSPFYEETPFRPDWLLNDFIRILHPELDNLAPLRYYKKL